MIRLHSIAIVFDYVYVFYTELYEYKIYPELRMWLQDDIIRMIRLCIYRKHIYVYSSSSCFTDSSFPFVLFHFTDTASIEEKRL
jgi:hypothetical protein